jgi:hypothetical protein
MKRKKEKENNEENEDENKGEDKNMKSGQERTQMTRADLNWRARRKKRGTKEFEHDEKL